MSTNLAAPIITTMIDIFLAGADNKDPDGGPRYNYIFSGQQATSLILLVLAFLTVPLMLLVKPLVLKRRLEAGHGRDVHVAQEQV